MHLVPAGPEHVDALLGLRDAAAEWLLGKGIEQWRPGQLPRVVVERRVADGVAFVALDPAGRVWATVTVDFADEQTWGARGADDLAGYVHGLIVDPAVTGQRIGREIMTWAEDRIRSHGRSLVRLDCAEANPVLRSWYRSLGYAEVGRREYGNAWFAVTLFERAV